jgi:hypothetical protein
MALCEAAWKSGGFVAVEDTAIRLGIGTFPDHVIVRGLPADPILTAFYHRDGRRIVVLAADVLMKAPSSLSQSVVENHPKSG